SCLFRFDYQFFAALDASFFRVGVDLGKVTKIFEAFLGRLDAHGIEHITGCDQNFTADYFIFGAGVSDNVDPLHERAITLLDLVMDIDQAGPGGSSLRQNHKIDISSATVGVRDRFRSEERRVGKECRTLESCNKQKKAYEMIW